ncbi:MAG: zinc-binding dehydrogenase [Candidatus Krumholzibacteriia bacterium]|nr:zinc-binding dehydrogenase [bacterium]MCB9513914.1 zinc-binding dehydrogenase [Candidatus Latescibacterota bacterium]MCB9517085.1 zinc-binding dehydrogenase [Candidatus Latescibacterota bacterium]
MKAVRIHEHGDLDVLRLETLPDPAPGPGQVLIEIKAIGVNHLDTWVRRGVPGHHFPLPITPGADAAGVVAALGAGVTGLAVGDRVAVAPGTSCGRCADCLSGRDHYCRHYGILGESGDGTDCEFIAVPAANALPLPEGLGFREAAAVSLVFLTAWEMLVVKGGVKTGDTVLVHAAGSGVSSAAIQIARHFGARVIASAGSEAKRERARELGASEVIDYTQDDWPREVRALTGKRGCDLVVDHVGATTFAGSLRALAGGGRILCCGASSGPEFTADLRPIFFKNLAIVGSTMGSRGSLPLIYRLVAEGRLRAVIDSVLPLDQVAEAHRRIADRALFGKILLEP